MSSELARLNISLPDAMLQKVNQVIGEGDYATPSEFIRDALRHEFERRQTKSEREAVMAHLRDMIDEGLRSGPAVPITDLKTWQESRAKRLEERLHS